MSRTLRRLVLGACLMAAPAGVILSMPEVARGTDAAYVAKLKVGDKLEVKWGATWWRASVVKTEPGKVTIKYDGWGENWNESVGPDRVRPVTPGAKVGGQGQVFDEGGPAANVPNPPNRPARPNIPGRPNPPVIPPPATNPAAPPPTAQQPTGVVDTTPAVDLSAVREIPPAPAAAWAAKPDPAPAGKPSAGKVIKFNKTNRTDRQMPTRVFFTDAATGQGLVVYFADEFFEKPATCQVFRFDVATGQPFGGIALADQREVVATSPDGKLAAARVTPLDPKWQGRRPRAERADTIEIIRLAGNPAPVASTFRPYPAGEHPADVHFIDNQHLLTSSTNGLIVLWKLGAGGNGVPTPVYKLKAGVGLAVTLSPGKKTFAIETGGTVRLHDTMTGASLGVVAGLTTPAGIPGPAAFVRRASAAFRPDGGALAIARDGLVSIIDVATGKPTTDIPIPGDLRFIHALVWTGPGHVLLGNRYLVDVTKRVVVWAYYPWFNSVAVHGGRVWYSLPGDSLGSIALPHPEAAAFTPQVNVDELTVFKPGRQVSIDVQGDAPDDVKERVRKGIEAKVKELGMTVADGQPVVISTRTEPVGDAKQIQYRMFGRGVETLSVTDLAHKLVVTQDGEEAWSTQIRAGVPMVISVKQDESAADVVQRQQMQSFGGLANVALPRTVVKKTAYEIGGHSRLGVNGLEPYTPPPTP